PWGLTRRQAMTRAGLASLPREPARSGLLDRLSCGETERRGCCENAIRPGPSATRGRPSLALQRCLTLGRGGDPRQTVARDFRPLALSHRKQPATSRTTEKRKNSRRENISLGPLQGRLLPHIPWTFGCANRSHIHDALRRRHGGSTAPTCAQTHCLVHDARTMPPWRA